LQQLAGALTEKDKEEAEKTLQTLKKIEWLCEYYEKTIELSRRLTEWSITEGVKLAQTRTYTGVTRYHIKTRGVKKQPSLSIIDEDKLKGGERK